MTNYAIILSGGSGVRFGADMPKQFVRIDDKAILWHTLRAFNECKLIDKIIVVANHNFLNDTKNIADEFSKVESVVAGGKKTRSQSAYNGVMAVAQDAKNVLIHDGVRPFVSDKIIKDCINALENYDCVASVLSTTDTLYEIENGKVKNIPDRDNFVMAQTPQGFKYKIIKQAYEMYEEKLTFSDDISIVKHYLPNKEIFLVEGDVKNIKITTENDLK